MGNVIPNNYIFHKAINWSMLVEGFNIDVNFQNLFYYCLGQTLVPGQNTDITILLNNQEFRAKVYNLKIDTEKNSRKSHIVHVKYRKNSPITIYLKSVFSRSYSLFKTSRDQGNKKGSCSQGEEEYLVLYSTMQKGVFVAESIVYEEHEAISNYLSTVSEERAEEIITFEEWKDPMAAIKVVNQLKKVRVLNQSIGRELKNLYKYKCQICGENFAEKYDGKIVEAHHIDSFVKSLNNDAKNLMIVCPSHHRTIHAMKPVYKRRKKLYLYPNGLEERLRLNEHL
ncbi:HNH endonuclease [bacterium]|nr:HNH endonuclease [bacterium]